MADTKTAKARSFQECIHCHKQVKLTINGFLRSHGCTMPVMCALCRKMIPLNKTGRTRGDYFCAECVRKV
jgi:hypothetical protein